MTPRLSAEEQQRRQELSLRLSSSDSSSSLQGRSRCSTLQDERHCSRSYSISYPTSIYSNLMEREKGNDNRNRVHTANLGSIDRNTWSSFRKEKDEVIERESSVRTRTSEKESCLPSKVVYSSNSIAFSQTRSHSQPLPNNSNDAWRENGKVPEAQPVDFTKAVQLSHARVPERASTQRTIEGRSVLSGTELGEGLRREEEEREILTARDPFLEDPPTVSQKKGVDMPRERVEETLLTFPPLPPHPIRKKTRKHLPCTGPSDSVSRSRSISWVDLAEGGMLEVMVSSSSSAAASRSHRDPPPTSARWHEYHKRRKTGLSSPFFSSYKEEEDCWYPNGEEDVIRDLEADEHLVSPLAVWMLREKQDTEVKEEEEESREEETSPPNGVMRKRRKEVWESSRDPPPSFDSTSSFMDHVRHVARKVPRQEGETLRGTRGSRAFSSLQGPVSTFVDAPNEESVQDEWKRTTLRGEEGKSHGQRMEQENSWKLFHCNAPTSPLFSNDFLKRGLERKNTTQAERSLLHASPLSSAAAFTLPGFLSSTSMEHSWESSSSQTCSSRPPFCIDRGAAVRTQERLHEDSSLSSSCFSNRGLGSPMFKGLSAIPLTDDFFEEVKAKKETPCLSVASRVTRTDDISSFGRNISHGSPSWSAPPSSRSVVGYGTGAVGGTFSSASSYEEEETHVQHASFSPSWCLIGTCRAAMRTPLRVEITIMVPPASGTPTGVCQRSSSPLGGGRRDRLLEAQEGNGGTSVGPSSCIDAAFLSFDWHHRGGRAATFSLYDRKDTENDNRSPSKKPASLYTTSVRTGYLRWVFMKPTLPSAKKEHERRSGGIVNASPPQYPLTLSLEKIETVLLNQIVLEGEEPIPGNLDTSFLPSHARGYDATPHSHARHIQERYIAVTIRMMSGCRPQQVTFGFDGRQRNEARRLRTLLLMQTPQDHVSSVHTM